MTTTNNIETLRKRHLDLLENTQPKDFDQEHQKIDTETLKKIKIFLRDVHNAGSTVSDPQERDLLRSFILYWGTFPYETTDNYPDIMTLAPFAGKVPRRGLWSDRRTRIAIVFIGVLVLSLGALQLIRSYWSFRQLLTVRILEPINGDSVPYKTQVRGDYRGSVEEQNLWVIVYPHRSDRYYPQRPAEIQDDNSWLVDTRIGEDALRESGKRFDISVYAASSEADQMLSEYVSQAASTGNWPGIPSVSDGLILLDRVTVVRR